MSGSSLSAVSSRFSRLRTSHPGGDDAVSRTISAVGLDETDQISLIAPTSIYSLQSTQDFVIKGQWSIVLCRPSPGPEGPVSNERIAPSRFTPTAKVGLDSRVVWLSVVGLLCRWVCSPLAAGELWRWAAYVLYLNHKFGIQECPIKSTYGV